MDPLVTEFDGKNRLVGRNSQHDVGTDLPFNDALDVPIDRHVAMSTKALAVTTPPVRAYSTGGPARLIAPLKVRLPKVITEF